MKGDRAGQWSASAVPARAAAASASAVASRGDQPMDLNRAASTTRSPVRRSARPDLPAICRTAETRALRNRQEQRPATKAPPHCLDDLRHRHRCAVGDNKGSICGSFSLKNVLNGGDQVADTHERAPALHGTEWQGEGQGGKPHQCRHVALDVRPVDEDGPEHGPTRGRPAEHLGRDRFGSTFRPSVGVVRNRPALPPL